MKSYAWIVVIRLMQDQLALGWQMLLSPKFWWCKIVGHDYNWTQEDVLDETWCCRRCGWYDEGGNLVHWLRMRWYDLGSWLGIIKPTIIDLRDIVEGDRVIVELPGWEPYHGTVTFVKPGIITFLADDYEASSDVPVEYVRLEVNGG